MGIWMYCLTHHSIMRGPRITSGDGGGVKMIRDKRKRNGVKEKRLGEVRMMYRTFISFWQL